MSLDWKQLDPAWAWSEYEPTPQQPWTPALAAHLFRRAGFAAGPEQLRRAAEQSPQALVTELFAETAELESFRQDSQDLVRAMIATGEPQNLAPWWLHRMLHTPQPLKEKATLFWHGHFATSAEKVADIELMYEQNQMLREHALGDFRQLVQGISRNPAMLIYLDSVTNRKAHPNENYAREVMELFCLGEGNYSEQDVQQLARCFTGWEIRRKNFRFNQYQHDFGEKSILGESATFGGEEAVDVVLQQDAAPRFIVRKLIRFFLCDEPTASDELIEPLARQLRDDNLHVGGVLRRIFSSNLFFSPLALARQIRSPIDLAVGLLRALDGSANVRLLAEETAQLGHSLFYPPNVKGWDGGRAWINSATLLGRANFVRRLLSDANTRFGRGGLLELARRFQVHQPEDYVAWLAGQLIAVPLPEAVRAELVSLARRNENEDNYREVLYSLATLPEFQLA